MRTVRRGRGRREAGSPGRSVNANPASSSNASPSAGPSPEPRTSPTRGTSSDVARTTFAARSGRSSPGPGRSGFTPSRSRERGLQALDHRDGRGVDAATDREVHAGEVPDHDERHQPRERRRPARMNLLHVAAGRRARCRRRAGTAEAAADPRRRDGAPPRRNARRTAPSIPRPRCDPAPTSRTRTPAASRSRSSGSSSGRPPRDPMPSAPQMTGQRSPILVASVFAGLSSDGTVGPMSASTAPISADRLVDVAGERGQDPHGLERAERGEPQMPESRAGLIAGGYAHRRDPRRGSLVGDRASRGHHQHAAAPLQRSHGTMRASPPCSRSTTSHHQRMRVAVLGQDRRAVHLHREGRDARRTRTARHRRTPPIRPSRRTSRT